MNTIRDIFETIESIRLDESIQALIKDMKSVQHGDISNPLYDKLLDYHLEGGVWKHTKLTIDALPEVAKALGKDYEILYEKFKNELRAAALYHDIGKIITKRTNVFPPGVHTFTKHETLPIVKTVLADYDIKLDQFVIDLITNHHATPDQIFALAQNWHIDQAKLLIILKAADKMAVGPRSANAATEAMLPYLPAIDAAIELEQNKAQIKKQNITFTKDWNIEDISFENPDQVGLYPEKFDKDGHVIEPDISEKGSANVKILVSLPYYAGNFEKEVRQYIKQNPEFKQEIREYLIPEIQSFVFEQDIHPEKIRGISIDFSKSFDIVEDKEILLFYIYGKVSW